MQKITEEAFATIAKTKNGHKHPVAVAIEQLEVGEILQINAGDWHWRGKSPSIFVTRLEKSSARRFEFYKQTQARGWLVKRVH